MSCAVGAARRWSCRTWTAGPRPCSPTGRPARRPAAAARSTGRAQTRRPLQGSHRRHRTRHPAGRRNGAPARMVDGRRRAGLRGAPGRRMPLRARADTPRPGSTNAPEPDRPGPAADTRCGARPPPSPASRGLRPRRRAARRKAAAARSAGRAQGDLLPGAAGALPPRQAGDGHRRGLRQLPGPALPRGPGGGGGHGTPGGADGVPVAAPGARWPWVRPAVPSAGTGCGSVRSETGRTVLPCSTCPARTTAAMARPPATRAPRAPASSMSRPSAGGPARLHTVRMLPPRRGPGRAGAPEDRSGAPSCPPCPRPTPRPPSAGRAPGGRPGRATGRPPPGAGPRRREHADQAHGRSAQPCAQHGARDAAHRQDGRHRAERSGAARQRTGDEHGEGEPVVAAEDGADAADHGEAHEAGAPGEEAEALADRHAVTEGVRGVGGVGGRGGAGRRAGAGHRAGDGPQEQG